MTKNQIKTKPNLWVVNIATCDPNTQVVNLSGGERILLECLKHWKKMFASIDLVCDVYWSLKSQNYLEYKVKISYHTFLIPKFFYSFLGFLFPYKVIISFLKSFVYKLPKNTILYSSSDIFPDTLAAFFIKLRNPGIKWCAAYYFFASYPFGPEFPYKGVWSKIRGFLYWFTQKFCYYIIRKNSDFIFICNDIDRKRLVKDGYANDRLYSVYGGVDLAIPKSVPNQKKIYDAVFMARFHPQKGPMEAVLTWKEIVKVKKEAKLAMIGNGPEEAKVKNYIRKNNLEKNITLLGFMDGKEKYKVLKSAKIFLHTPIYDTGGMAAAEGMAAGLPVVAFNIPGYSYIYPRGIINQTKIGDVEGLAKVVLNLLSDPNRLKELQAEVAEFIQGWGWEKRASLMYKYMINS